MRRMRSTGLRLGHVSFDGPAPLPDFKEQLEQKIQQKRDFIEKYSNYQWLCDEAELYIKWAQERLQQIEKVQHQGQP